MVLTHRRQNFRSSPGHEVISEQLGGFFKWQDEFYSFSFVAITDTKNLHIEVHWYRIVFLILQTETGFWLSYIESP